MAIYTKKGDKGKTSLYNSAKEKVILKDSLIIETIGSIDEANCSLGLAGVFCKNFEDKKLLVKVQNDLMTINSILAGSKMAFPKSKTRFLEKEIDRLEAKLPKLNHFIIPGGSLIGAYLHSTRSIVRRAERILVGLSNQEKISLNILSYINRLSDLVFLLARKSDLKEGCKEVSWTGRKK